MDCSMPGFPVLHYLPEFAQTQIRWVGDAIQPSHPLVSPSSLAFNPPQHQGLFSESALRIRWPKYWSFSFSISPSNEYSGLISFRMDWLDLLAVQETLKNLLCTTVQKHQFFLSVRKWPLTWFSCQSCTLGFVVCLKYCIFIYTGVFFFLNYIFRSKF